MEKRVKLRKSASESGPQSILRRPRKSTPRIKESVLSHTTAPDKAPGGKGGKLRAVVGIGASAGGLEAMTLLLQNLPRNTGMAFVYVQHLDRTRVSMLIPILARVSPIPVKEATQGTKVLANTLYVIPSNKGIYIERGVLHLTSRASGTAEFLTIDTFFRSLATDQGGHSIGIVLSGNASDGTEGLRSIWNEGGITFAQREDTASYPSMPHSAITLGSVDHILSPGDIGKELGKISRHPHIADTHTLRESGALFDSERDTHAFGEVLALLTEKIGVNFENYKPMTLKRRIARRMVIHKIESIAGYVRHLRESPKEVDELFQDVLINVTEFFRDPEVFAQVKKKVFPALIKHHTKNEHIRIWVAGSSTGEEVYSLAIAFAEYLSDHDLHVPVQIFGTDLSESCIEHARRGVYPASIGSNVSKERLRRFFIDVDGSYQVTKMIRDMCTFAKQNVISDPPFSRMDLISCRNVMIYLEASAQKRVLQMFHFALKQDGILMLGKSEGVGQSSDLFHLQNKQSRFFTKKVSSRTAQFDKYTISKRNIPVSGRGAIARIDVGQNRKVTPSEIDQAMLSSSVMPSSVVVDSAMEILQFRGDLSAYLQFPKGKASFNLMKVINDGLIIELREAIASAERKNGPSVVRGIQMNQKGEQLSVDIEVIPIIQGAPHEKCMLVIFDQQKNSGTDGDALVRGASPATPRESLARLARENARLQRQLDIARGQMRAVIEAQDSTNEEFQSANEQVLSSNEELQSINEEIETTKEELQSTNEELITVNDELQLRVGELNVTNSDLSNVLSSSRVPIIIVDKQLRIRRVTPITKKSIHISATDVGRPIADIRLPIKFPNLKKSIVRVIDTMQSTNEDVVDESGNWYTLWIRPYRTMDNRIDGAIITLIDINEIKLTQLRHELSLRFLQGILQTMREPVLILDKKFHVLSGNKAFYDTFQLKPEATEHVSLFSLGEKEWDTPEMRKLFTKAIRSKNSTNYEIEQSFFRTKPLAMCVNVHRFTYQHNKDDSLLLVMEDITARKFVLEKSNTFMSMASHELRTPATTIKLLAEILQKHVVKSGDKILIEYLEKIVGEVDHLARISSDLLDVSAIKSGKFVLTPQTFLLSTLVREIVDGAQLLTKTHRIVLQGATRIFVKADRERIGRALINLIGNAIKYSPKANKVIVKLHCTNKIVTVSIRDFGIGIAKKDHDRIFDYSTQVAQEKAQHSRGLGLGLYISSTIIQGHGSRIAIESHKSTKGTTFSFTLPLAGK